MYSEINIIIFLFVFIFIILFIYNKYKETEMFETKGVTFNNTDGNSFLKKKFILKTIVPNLNNNINTHSFIAAFEPPNNDGKIKNFLIKTHDLNTLNLDNGHWNSIRQGELPYGNLIEHLCWHRDEKIGSNTEYNYFKRLMCIVKTNKDKNEFTIFIKQNSDIESNWIEYRPNGKDIIQNKMIHFIIYDLRNNLIGLNNINHQIYKLNEQKCIWEGPINTDHNVKMKRLIFDWDRKMLGLDNNNIIWKKNSLDWVNSNWKTPTNSKINYIDNIEQSITIFDLIHDTDGRLIGLSKEHGLVKQSNYNFNSHFVKYKDNVIDDKDKKDENKFFATYPSVDYYNIHTPTQNDQTIMNSIDIFMNKTGIDSINYDYINTQGETLEQVNLIKKLNYMIVFK
jgi:hypothetical protein